MSPPLTQPTYQDIYRRLIDVIAEQNIDKPFHRAAFVVDQAAVIQVELGLDSDSARLLASAAANAFRSSFPVVTIGVEANARAIQISMLEGS